MIFEHAMWRFAISGTLILFFGIADRMAARRGPKRAVPSPKWKKPLIFASITAYYLLIKPAGGELLGGAGNVAGLVLVGLAIALRLSRAVIFPELAGRALFYIALPIAVGVPWGLLALSLPAVASSLWVARRELAEAPALDLSPRHRLLPGVW